MKRMSYVSKLKDQLKIRYFDEIYFVRPKLPTYSIDLILLFLRGWQWFVTDLHSAVGHCYIVIQVAFTSKFIQNSEYWWKFIKTLSDFFIALSCFRYHIIEFQLELFILTSSMSVSLNYYTLIRAIF